MTQPNFNYIARPYRWLEYLSLGKALERCRFHFLPLLRDCRRALVLGDGDGRFTAKLLESNPFVEIDAIDISPAMLTLLRKRSEAWANRIATYHADALTFPYETAAEPYDLVVTHFFLDCLTQAELERMMMRIKPALAPRAIWIVSDFRIPAGPMRFPARAYVRSLYLAFRVLTGLRTTRLPDHAASLIEHGFVREDYNHSLAGLLSSELWQQR